MTENCNECLNNKKCKEKVQMQKTRQAIEAVARLSTAYFSVQVKCDYHKLDKEKLPKREGCCNG